MAGDDSACTSGDSSGAPSSDFEVWACRGSGRRDGVSPPVGGAGSGPTRVRPAVRTESGGATGCGGKEGGGRVRWLWEVRWSGSMASLMKTSG